MADGVKLCFLLFLLFFSWGQTGERGQAVKHRQQFSEAEQVYHTYISLAVVPEDKREGLLKALNFMLASSSTQPILEYCSLEKVGDGLYHLDLQRIRWDTWAWIETLKSYPYHTGKGYPLVVRGDWLLYQLSDTAASKAYSDLLYGLKKAPKTLKEFRAFWGVNSSPELAWGLIEGRSGVSVQQVRWLENRPLARGYYWETRDVLQVVPGKDPLEALDGKFEFDGGEVIAGIPKVSIKTGIRGALQVYLLADARGNVVQKADTDLVEDHSRFKGLAAIRTNGSCIGCHEEGIIFPSTNEVRELIKSGVDIYAKDKKLQEKIELFHLGQNDDQITYQRLLYSNAVFALNGLAPKENAAYFKVAVEDYDKDMTLDDVAREFYLTAEDMKLAIANYSNATPLPARVAALAHNKPIPRASYEKHWALLSTAVKLWADQ